jgi:hypothetical protein
LLREYDERRAAPAAFGPASRLEHDENFNECLSAFDTG